jgi:hypothetical protein
VSLNGFNTTDMKSPRGAWTDLDQVEARPDRASSAVNVRFGPGRVRTRDGYVTALAVSNKVTSMHQWIAAGLNRLIFYEGSAVKMKNLLTPDPSELVYSLAGRAASVGEAGDKVYVSVYDSTGLGACPVVAATVTAGVLWSGYAFMAPLQTVPALVDNPTGSTTPGLHYFGYVVESNTGFVGSPSPVSPTGTFVPASKVVASGIVTMTLVLSVTNPPITVYPIMTRSDNLNKWFYVPGVSHTFTSSGLQIVNFTIDISDEDLASTASSADSNFSYLTQTQASTGPFSPSILIPYNRRMCYVVNDKVYISDIDNYETLTEDRHVVQVPGKRRVITGFPLRGSLYLLGPGWTYVSTDNGNDPREWPVPQEVSSALGTLSPTGVEWRTAGDYAWIASESGLWFFNGQYSEKPISYQNSEIWRRINWGAASAVQVREHTKEQCVYVAAPLDTATECSHILIWNFGLGMEPFTVDFSYDLFLYGTFSSICPVQDPTTGKAEMWVGPSSALGAGILKQSFGAHHDEGWGSPAAILGLYNTGFQLPDSLGIKRLGAVELSVDGSGSLKLAAYGKDQINATLPPAITMAAAPGKNYRQRFSLNDENISFEIKTTEIGDWFDLTSLRTYWKPYLRNR